jgi:hypothetical protein
MLLKYCPDNDSMHLVSSIQYILYIRGQMIYLRIVASTKSNLSFPIVALEQTSYCHEVEFVNITHHDCCFELL